MSEVSFQRSTIVSFLIHLSVFAITLVVVRQSNHFVMPSPYVVTLVNPEAFTVGQENTAQALKNKTAEESRTKSKETMHAPQTLTRNDEKLIEKRIDALKNIRKNETLVANKITALKELEKIRRALKIGDVIEVKKENQEAKIGPATGATAQDYSRLVGEDIRRHWQFPTDLLKDKNIEAIVSIRIQKNGSVQILGIEKSSGNPLFDRSALRAITKASPVVPPPYEIEIGVRFYP
jgi:colicin import membrane protein